MRRQVIWLVATFCFLVTVPDLAWSSKLIEVDGVGTSRNEAISDGLRTAVEQIVGLFLVSESQVKNLILQNDTITTESAGFVKTYQILSWTRERGLDKCRLAVEVESDENKIALFLRRLLGKKTFSVQVSEYIGNRPLNDRSLAQSLTKDLISKGYYVVRKSYGPFYQIEGTATAREARSQYAGPSFKVVNLADMRITLSDKSGMALAVYTTRDAGDCTGSGNTLEEAGVDLFRCLDQKVSRSFIRAIEDKI